MGVMVFYFTVYTSIYRICFHKLSNTVSIWHISVIILETVYYIFLSDTG